jgi:hypothetical protein
MRTESMAKLVTKLVNEDEDDEEDEEDEEVVWSTFVYIHNLYRLI